MIASDSIKSGIYLAALAAAGYVAYQAYKKGQGIAGSVADLWTAGAQQVEQASANVQSAWGNTVSGPFQRGQDYVNGVAPVVSSKAWLYSDLGYTGQDLSGQLVTDGEWYGNADARRYDAAQPPAARPAATSNNGAAFGVFASPMGSNAKNETDERMYAGGSSSFDERTGTYANGSGGGGKFTGSGASGKW